MKKTIAGVAGGFELLIYKQDLTELRRKMANVSTVVEKQNCQTVFTKYLVCHTIEGLFNVL